LAQSLAGTGGALLARQVGGTDAVAGLPQALLVVGAAVSALALSALTRRRGRGLALSLGAGVAVAGCLVVMLAGMAGHLPGILVGSLLLGSGTTAVMLGRYAAADLGPATSRAAGMASVLTATTIGAVAGPNLLAPTAALAAGLGMPALTGPYLVAAAGFTAAGGALAVGLGTGRPRGTPAPRVAAGKAPGSGVLSRSGAAGLGVLGVANLVMVSVMTMAPVQLHHVGVGLGVIGVVVSVHIAGMFAPSPLSGWLTDRVGPLRVAAGAAAMLVLACAIAAAGAASTVLLGIGLLLLGVGWNLALVAGSVLITDGVAAGERPRREGWGEVAMGTAAAGGGATAGPMVATGGYPTLAVAAASVAVAAVLLVGFGSRYHPSRRAGGAGSGV